LFMILVGFVFIVIPELLNWNNELLILIVRDVGLALLIAGVVGSGYEFATRGSFLEEVERALEEVVGKRYEELDKVRASGLKTVHREKFYADVEEKFRDAKASIRILQTWSGEFNSLGSPLRQAAERGCEIRILLLKPNSVVARQRGADVGHGEEAVEEFINNDLTVLATLRARLSKKTKENIEVRLYDTTPVIAIYGCDDTNIVGIYWYGRHSQEGPQFEVVGRLESASDDPYFSSVVNEHFEAIWERATVHKWAPNSESEPREIGVDHRSEAPNGQRTVKSPSERQGE
jgi:hypothetical protein